MNRGLEKRDIFLNADHKNQFIDLLSQISEKYKVEIHGYCLMNNHYHILLKLNMLNLHLAMKHLNGVYTSKFNKDVNRDGPLFRGRYKSILIDKENYLINVSRYIHKNPSAANIIKDDSRYIWSSYQYYCNLKPKPTWLYCDEVFNYFNNRQEYIDFVNCDIDDHTRNFYLSKKLKSIFGDKSFIKDVIDKNKVDLLKRDLSNKGFLIDNQYPSKDEIISKLERNYQLDINLLFTYNSKRFNYARHLFIYLIMHNPRYNLKQKGEFLNISGDAISKSYKRFIERISLDDALNRQVKEIEYDVYG